MPEPLPPLSAATVAAPVVAPLRRPASPLRAGPYRAWLPFAAALLALAGAALPVRAGSPAVELAELSLERLREVVVTTVSRSDERLDKVAASVYVISADDIRRSGATTLPEALRLAPLLSVARADGSQYAISARGFDNVYANKMLVLIDGRNVYTPLFSGVFWEAQDVMLEDVERIEVVTGPSTALWGSNAVNALVHVITRPATATQGLAFAAQAGADQRGAALRWGGTAGAVAWRAWLKSTDRTGSRRSDGSLARDAADGQRLGMRADWSNGRDSYALLGDAHQGRADQPTEPRHFSGASLTARWQRQHGADGGADGAAHSSLQLVLDHSTREHPQSFSDRMDTVDLVGQHSLNAGPGHRLVVGGGLRQSRDHASGSAALAFIPGARSLLWRRLFAQDQVQLSPRLVLTLAGSVESNPYTGTGVLPSLRLAWTGPEQAVWWASLSRSERAPSRVDRDVLVPAAPPFQLAGGPAFRSELSDVLELGWRAQQGPSTSFALTAWHARHRQLRSLAPTPAGPQWENGFGGHSSGIEGWARWRAGSRWRLDAGLVLQQQRLALAPGAQDVGGSGLLGNSPPRHGVLRSSLDFAGNWRWDADLRHAGALPNPAVPAYTAVDSRLSWSPAPRTDLALGVTNLFDRRHAEWGPIVNRVEFERAVFLRLRLWH